MVARRQVLRRLGAAVAGLALAAAGRTALAQAQRPVGRVTRQVGSAQAVRAEGTTDLAVGAEIYIADRLVTEPGARLEISFVDGTLTILGPSTDVTVEVFVTAGDGRGDGVLSLLSGIVRAVVAPAGGGFAIEGRVAVASVRSTELVVEVVDDRMSVLALQGIVDVSRGDATVSLGPGEGADIQAGDPLPEPHPWGPPRIADVVSRTSMP